MAGSANVVHIWTVDLRAPPVSLEIVEATLSADENERANRFFFEQDRRRFAIARGTLRLLLGQYLQRDPASIPLSYSSYGKPMLKVEASSALRFNLSHSADRIVYAISSDGELGVDIEQVRPLVDMEAIARLSFSVCERIALMSLRAPDRLTGFYRCWTRKEAYLKALGDGLARPLSDFDVSVLPEAHTRLLHVGWEPGEASRWTLSNLDLGPEYVGTLAVEGPPAALQQWNWDGGAG